MARKRRRAPRTGPLQRASWGLLILLSLAVFFFLLRLPLCRLLVKAEIPEERDYHLEVAADGFSLYRETVLVAPLSGRVEPAVRHGELVPRGKEIAHLEDTHASRAYGERFEEVAEQLLSWRTDHLQDLQRATRSASSRGEAAVSALMSFKSASATGEAREIAWKEFIDSVDGFAESRQQARRLLKEWETRAQHLFNLRDLLSRAEGEIVAVNPGIVLLGSDGLEDALDWEMELNRKKVAELAGLSDGVAVGVEAGDEWTVTAGEAVARIAQPDELHAILLLPCRDTAALNEGDVVQVDLQLADQVVDAEVLTVGGCHDDSLAVRVAVRQALPDLYARRSWQAVVRRSVGRGQVICTSQLVRRDGSPGVYLWVDNRPQWTGVEVLISDGNEAVVRGIPRGARVVLNPRVIISFLLG